MQYARYPFIDLAVHPAIRERFAAGDALAIASPALDEVIWANGAAAQLFGYASIYEFIEEGIAGRASLRRQIAVAVNGLSRKPGQDFMIRSQTGFRNSIVPAHVELIELPGGAPAILISAPAPVILRGVGVQAQHIIRGFEDTGTHVAVLDVKGKILAGSLSLTNVELSPAECLQMVEDVAGEADRLVKRMVSTNSGSVAVAIGRLTDDPALHLLFAVEPAEGISQSSGEPSPSPAPRDEAAGDLWDAVPPQNLQPDRTDMPTPAEPVTEELDDIADLARLDGANPLADGITATDEAFTFDPHAPPVRFVWKIDRNGAFSEASPEFAQAVGPNAADIIGRKFSDIARVFNLDPDRTITDLLGRRDTWSGKTVNWPVQGTDLVVPVDLAALPTYTRDRTFDGFRGFGIVRVGEAAPDPEALGLALRPASPGPSETGTTQVAPKTATQHPGDPFKGERPALQITPTPKPRETEKVIDLGARRARNREELSPIEQAAFREIGARLGASAKDAQQADNPEKQPRQDSPTRSEAKPPHLDDDEATRQSAPEEFADDASTGENHDHPAAGGEPDIVDQTPLHGAEEQEPSAPGAPLGAHTLPDSAQVIPSAFALPARQAAPYSMNESLIEAIPAALLVHTGDRLIYANPEFVSLTGYQSLSELDATGGLDHLLERPETGEAETNGLMSMRKSDGGEISVTARLRSINWHNSQALLLAIAPWQDAGFKQDDPASTETTPADKEPSPPVELDESSVRRLGELEVEASELRSILETATDGVAILDNDGTIRSMNGSACALFGYDEDETRGQPFAMLFAHESQRAVMDYLSGLAEHGVSSVLNDGREVIGREANGGFLPLFMTMGRLTGSNGYCVVLRDITQWKRSEDELRNAKRAAETANSHKSDFLARVSHEIRTPLNAIIGFSEMMVGERFGPIGSSRYLEYAHDIGNSGRHVLDIVNDLLDISKIEAGEVELEFSAVSINDQLVECVSMLQPMANARRVIVRTSLSASVPEVVADSRSIKQIALNLLSNAIRYTPSGGQIVVSTSYEASGNVVLRIRDTGVGMTRKELEQAMKPFGQVGPGPRQKGDGTGLGLPLTKAMVEANRAQFEIVSAPSDGTLVSVTFPPQRVLAD